MTKTLEKKISRFHKKLAEAQDARAEVMDYLEDHGIDTRSESESIEDPLTWCYGIKEDRVEKLLEARKRRQKND